MGANSAYSGSYTAATETDLYTNSSGTLNTIILGIDVYNPETTAQDVEIWITDGSNNHKGAPLFKGEVATVTAISNQRKYVLLPGYKIRFKAETNTVLFEMSVFEDLE